MIRSTATAIIEADQACFVAKVRRDKIEIAAISGEAGKAKQRKPRPFVGEMQRHIVGTRKKRHDVRPLSDREWRRGL